MAIARDKGSLGNVQSRDFQFAEVEWVRGVVLGGRPGQLFSRGASGTISWMESPPPKELKPVLNRWIYAFELGERDVDQKTILAAEYHADEHGALSFVPGYKRRMVDLKGAGIEGTPVPAASLPIIRQSDCLRYFFVAVRGRLTKRVIRDIENDPSPFFVRHDLADEGAFHRSAGKAAPFFVRATDPLTVGENLHRLYLRALNEFIRFNCPMKDDPDAPKIEKLAAKYHLGRLLRDNFLMRNGQHVDPLEIASHLKDEGSPLLQFLSDHEKKLDKLAEEKEKTATDLVVFLRSDVWRSCQFWYRASLDAAYHFWLESAACCVERLIESRVGARYLHAVVVEREAFNLPDELLEPEEGADERIKKHFEEAFKPARKIATGVFLTIAEFMPALIVYRKKTATERVASTLRAHLHQTTISVAGRTASGRFTAQLNLQVTSLRLDMDYKRARPDLKAGLDDGKPHWPPGTGGARATEVLGKLMWAVEFGNFCNVLSEFADKQDKKWTDYLEPPGAVLDLLIAFEDLIREYVHEEVLPGGGHAGAGHGQSAPHGGKGAVSGGKAAVEELEAHAGSVARAGKAAEGAEVAELNAKHRILAKLVSPMAFKVLGAASAAIDVIVNMTEGYEAWKKHETGVAAGHLTAATGAALLLAGSVGTALSYGPQAALGILFSCSLLSVGAFIFVVGLLIVSHFSRSAFQKFARYCIFGKESGHHGIDTWVQGNFSEWDDSPRGIDLQIRHLMVLLCDFKVFGTGEDDRTIHVSFGVLPPEAEVEVEFCIEYENGTKLLPRYAFDPEEGTVKSAEEWRDMSRFYFSEDAKPQTLTIGAPRPARLTQVAVLRTTCEVRIVYGKGNKASIPLPGPVKYTVFDKGRGARMKELRSVDVEFEEKPEHEAKAGEHAGHLGGGH